MSKKPHLADSAPDLECSILSLEDKQNAEQYNKASTFVVNSIAASKSKTFSPTKAKLRKEIRALKQKVRRRDQKIESLLDMLNLSKKIGLMSNETATMLDETFGLLPADILLNQLKNKNLKPSGHRFSSSLKEFALTLYFYSPRSYNFLRKKICLPHPGILRSWVSSVNCAPGFMEEAFSYLKDLESKILDFKDCALIIDAMSIRKQALWDRGQNKYSGYVDCCGLIDGKENCLASEALVFLVVSFTKRIKIPVSYFFIDKINSQVLSQLINICIDKLHAIGIKIWSVTADGISANIQAFQLLGCKIAGISSVSESQT